jgi:hypothetical protein
VATTDGASAPRNRPGDAARSSGSTGGSPQNGSPELERREVRAADPHLSPETNARLTEELREVIGAAEVEIPAGRARVSEGEYDIRRTWWAHLTQNRVNIVRLLLIALTFGAIIALVTNVWWLLPLAAGVHALGTMVVTLATVHLTTISEHPSATLAAALTEQGISGADEHFTRMVDEFRPVVSGEGGDILSAGPDDLHTSPLDDAALAGAEQSRALTPASGPDDPTPAGGTPDYLIWTTVAGLFVVSFVIPPLSGTAAMWLLPVVTVPLLGGLTWLELTMGRNPERVQVHGVRQMAVLTLAVVVAVAAFCAAIAIGIRH